MKFKFFLFIFLSCFVFLSYKGFGDNAYPDTIRSKDGTKKIVIARTNKDLYWNVQNKFTIRSGLDMIREVLIDSGRVIKENDTIYSIKPIGKTSVKISFFGKERFDKKYAVKKLPEPTRLYFKGIPINGREANDYLFTIDDLKKHNKLEAETDGYVFKVQKFWLGIPYLLEWSLKLSKPKLSEPIEFKSDSLSREFIIGLEKRNDHQGIYPVGVELISPDSTLVTISSMGLLGYLMKDSTSLIIKRYGGYRKTHSDVRIKVLGKPDDHDLKTINEITREINLCLPTLKVKQVNHFPSLTINFDSTSKPLNIESSFLAQELTSVWGNSNLFFPLLTKSTFNINCNIYNQSERESLLWRIILRKMFTPQREPNNSSSVIIGSRKAGLSYEDKLAIKTIFSRGVDKKIYELWPNMNALNASVWLKFILILVINIVLYLIFSEFDSYYKIVKDIYMNELRKRLIYSLSFAWLVFITIWILQPDSVKEFGALHYNTYLTSFSMIAGVLFLYADKAASRLNVRWQKTALLLNPVFTFISLYLAYQIIYLFVRAEFLRFQTIDQRALIVGFSIIAVRFYQEYERTKISNIVREKEFEIVRQKELKYRAELNALQARINPHFLYNALNSIAALTRIDAERTEKMALSLSKLFRFTLNREEDMLSTIGQEIEIAELYLGIEKHRYEDRLEYEIITDEKLKERKVPRLLIQPLVENAVKHGISKITGKGIIRIKVFEQSNDLFIEIYDNGPEFTEGLLSGYGLQNTYDKLSLIYKRPYEIKFINHPEKYLQIVLK